MVIKTCKNYLGLALKIRKNFRPNIVLHKSKLYLVYGVIVSTIKIYAFNCDFNHKLYFQPAKKWLIFKIYSSKRY